MRRIADARTMLRRMVGDDIVIVTSLEPALARVRVDPTPTTRRSATACARPTSRSSRSPFRTHALAGKVRQVLDAR